MDVSVGASTMDLDVQQLGRWTHELGLSSQISSHPLERYMRMIRFS